MDTAQTEKAVIGCMMFDGAKAVDVFCKAGGESGWFVDGHAKRAADAVLALHREGKPIDTFTVEQRAGDLPATFSGECVDAAVSPSHVSYYVEQLRGAAALRGAAFVMYSGQETIKEVLPEDAGVTIMRLAEQLYDICRGHAEDEVSLFDTAHQTIDKWTDPAARDKLIPWPIPRITASMGGAIEDELIWIIAQPSCGKTAFILQWAAVLAAAGFPASVASLESSKPRIVGRLLAYLARVDTLAIRRGDGRPEDIAKIRKAADLLKTLPLRVCDTGMTLEQIYAWGRSEVERGSRLIVVDNTRNIRNSGGKESRVEWMGSISARMKQLRDDTGCPVVVLHHSSRPNEKGKDDVSWSSDIRRDADCLIFLREDEERSVPPIDVNDQGRCCISFDVEKCRDGLKSIRIPLEFVKWRQTFVEWIDEGYAGYGDDK
jgi:replicative DNA helicase